MKKRGLRSPYEGEVMPERPRVVHSILDANDMARAVEGRYDLARPLRGELFRIGMNDVYSLRSDNARYAARVYRAGWHSTDDVDYELAFLHHLGARGLPVVAPVPDRNGDYRFAVEASEGRRDVVLFRWVPGRPLTRAPSAELARRAGALAAEIHRAGDDFRPHRQPRTTDYAGLLARELPSLLETLAHRPNDATYCAEAGSAIVAALEDVSAEKAPVGPVHGDMHAGNLFVTQDGGVTIMDFDNCGEGHYVEDLTCFRWSDAHRGRDPSIADAFIAGYEAVRPISRSERALFPLFEAAKQLWFMGGVASNVNAIGGAGFLDEGMERHVGPLREYMGRAMPA
jgi:Ser/Thr protein kinase RdoA (MazF antagonist)